MKLNPHLAKLGLNLIYFPLRLLPVRDCKIVFLSRQSNTVPLDFQLVIEELRGRVPNAEVVTICQRMGKGLRGQLVFLLATLRSIYHLATSRIAVLDSYWPAVSAIDLRREITVYQMWHSIGKIKQSGRATVGKVAGRDEELSQIMRMHEGYDFVVAGAPEWNPYYKDSFPVRDDQLLNISLPRSDYLHTQKDQIRERILDRYPQFGEKPTLLYAPTFRRGGGTSFGARRLIGSVDRTKYNIIVKGHANQPLVEESEGVYLCSEFSALELLTIADYLITDYSAIAIEAAVIDVPTYYYLFDLDEYLETNGLNIDLEDEMPGCVFHRVRHLTKALEGTYPYESLRAYKTKFVVPELGRATSDLVDSMMTEGKLCTR